jgi:hypothetical protein
MRENKGKTLDPGGTSGKKAGYFKGKGVVLLTTPQETP